MLRETLHRWLAPRGAHALDIDDPRALLHMRAVVRGKPFLRRIYHEWYRAIVAALPPGTDPVLELGSGGGFLDEFIPRLLTSEVQVCPHVRLILDGHALPFEKASLRAIVMTDVLHHLPDSPKFLREAGRCIRPGGRVIMIEPWVSAWSSLVYSHFHSEPFQPDARDWEFPRGGPLSAANMALPWIMFVRDRSRFDREFPEWRVVSVRPFMPLRYLVSGGVSLRSLAPVWTFSAFTAAERLLAWLGIHCDMFAEIVIERTSDG